MSLWLILTILAITSRAVYSIATKILSNEVKVSPASQGVLFTSLASVLTLIISPALGGISFHGIEKVWLVVLFMILSQAFGNVLFFKGIEKLEAGNTQIAFSSILIWGVLLSVIFLDSHFSLKQGAGIVLLLFAIIFAQYRKGLKEFNNYVVYIVASAGLFAIFQVTSAQLATTISTGAYLLLAYLGSVLIIGLIYLKKVSDDLKILRKNTINVGKYAFFASSTSLLYFLFSYFAYRIAPDRGIVVILLTSQVVLSVILGIVFLKEREGISRKLLAGFIALIAAILIKS